jgi:hypothetical protein
MTLIISIIGYTTIYLILPTILNVKTHKMSSIAELSYIDDLGACFVLQIRLEARETLPQDPQ